MHKLLLRQLKRNVGSVTSIPEDWKIFIDAVDEAYHQADTDRALLERSMDLTSQELFERNQQLRELVGGLEQHVAERTRDLSASEKRLRDITESSADWIWEVDGAGRYTYCSEQVANVLGYTAEEILGKTPFDLMPPDEATRVGKIFEEIARNREPIVDLENWNVSREGREVCLLTNGVPILDSAGNLLGYRGVDKDITKRKQAEEELEGYARQQAALFQLTANLAVTLDEADICREVVRGLHETLGYDHLGLFLVDRSTGERVLGASIGWPDAPPDRRIPPGHGLSERPLLDGQLHYTPDVTRDPRYVPGLNSGAEVDVPLRIGEKVLGVLVVESNQPDTFGERDFAALTAVANQASIALERAWEHQAVKKAEARYRSLFDGVPVGLYRTTPAGQILDANLAATHMLGYPDRESMLAINASDLYVDSEERQQWQIQMEREDTVRGFEIHFRRRDGTIIWVRDNTQAIRDDEGRVLYYEGSLEDITERKHADMVLWESEKRFRSVVQTASDAVIIIDHHKNMTFWNRAAETTFGYSAHETILNTMLASIMTEQFHQAYEEAIDQMITTGESSLIGKTIEVTGIRKDGSKFPLEFSIAPWKTRDGTFCTIIARDITKRKRAEEALEQHAIHLSLLNDIGGQVAAVLELDSVLDRAACLVQESFGYHHVALFAVDRERNQLVMRARAGDFATLFPPDHRLELGQGMVGWVGLHGETLPVNDVDAEPRYVNLYPDLVPTRSELSVPIRMGENIVGVLDVQSPQLDAFDENDVMVMETLADQVAVAIENARLYKDAQQELAERKRAERQLQRYATELEQANEEVKQFAYIVSHDLRAPLVNLKGFAAELRAALAVIGSAMNTTLPCLDDKLQPAVTTALQEDIPEALGFIDSSVTRMDHFIKALLKLSRLGRRELEREPVDINALVQATLQTLAHQIEEREVSVTVGSLPETVADRTSMEQILGNLLNNAVVYLDPGRPGEIEVTAERSDDEITFRVRDNGRGIAEKDMDKVFAPFRRAGRQDIPGEGMGLPYVQALVRRHGGRIWVESELGKGATFYFTIPADVKRKT